jgi:hypothetical protein
VSVPTHQKGDYRMWLYRVRNERKDTRSLEVCQLDPEYQREFEGLTLAEAFPPEKSLRAILAGIGEVRL